LCSATKESALKKPKENKVKFFDLPDAVFWVIFAVGVAAESLPGEPAHGGRLGESIVEAVGRVGREKGHQS